MWEKFGLQRRYMFSKEKSAVEGDPKKSWSGTQTDTGDELEEIGLEASLVGIHREEGGITFSQIERKTPVLRPTLQSKQSSLCGLHRRGDRGGGGPNGQIVSVKRTATKEDRETGRSLMKREKSTGPRTDPCGTPRCTGKGRLL